MAEFLTTRDVCQRLKLSVETFYKKSKRAQLRALGMPDPVFGRMGGQRWNSVAFDDWLAGLAGGQTDDFADELDRRAEALGGRHG